MTRNAFTSAELPPTDAPAAAEIGAWHVHLEAKGLGVIPWHRLRRSERRSLRRRVARTRRRLLNGQRLVVAPMQRLPGDGQPVPLAYAAAPAWSSTSVVTTRRPRRAAPRSVRRSTTRAAQANAPPGSAGSPGSPSRRGDSPPCPNGWRR